MRGKTPFQQLIEPEEAVKLFQHARTQEMYIARDLSRTYWAQAEKDSDIIWSFLSMLSFVYDTGRVQGMREERAKRKAKGG